MKHNKMRWMGGWLVLCLLIGMVFVGFAEKAEIELPEEIKVDGDMQLELGEGVDGSQAEDKKDETEVFFDLNGGLELDGLDILGTLSDELILDDSQTEEAVNTLESNANYTAYSNDTVFTIRGRSIKASSVANQNNCWLYANAIYKKIWDVSFTSDFAGSSSAGWNMLRNLSDNERKLTADNLKSFISSAELGASLRITSCTSSCSQWNNDGLTCGHNGHSLIIVGKDSGGVTVIDNHRADNVNYSVTTRYYSWQGFVNYWGKYTYIKYIKWPNAPVYGGSQPVVTASTLQFTNVTYPKTFRINTTAGWALSGGTVESNYDLKSLKTQILDSSGGVVSSATVSISGKSYAIRNLDTYSSNDNGVKFSYIKSAGSYKWVLTATDSNGRSLTLEMPFTAVSSGSTVTSTASKKWENEAPDSYKLLYKEHCGYTVTTEFNWHTGPSVKTPTAGKASVGNSFESEAVLWNTTTNNMWIKKKGEDKYVFAGYHWSGSNWTKDGTQYLRFDSANISIKWNNCNLQGTLPMGEPFSLQGTLDSDATMSSVIGEFYKGNSCWGNPTSEFAIGNTSYSLYNSQLDKAIKFGSLPAGDYKLVLHVYIIYNRGLEKYTNDIEKSFTIKDMTPTPTPTLTPTPTPTPTLTPTPTPTLTPTPTSDIVPTSIKLNKTKATVVVGGTVKLSVKLTPSDAETTLSWASSNANVAIVSDEGVVKALAKGMATITVTTDNGKAATCKITVPKAPTKVKFKKNSYTVKKGKTIKLVPVLTPSDAKTTYKWTSSNKKIATVNSKGVVKGIKKGTVKITVKTANGKSKTVTVKVK